MTKAIKEQISTKSVNKIREKPVPLDFINPVTILGYLSETIKEIAKQN